jgi:hypothetical protein
MFLFGAVLALVALGAFGFLYNHGGQSKPFRASSTQTLPPADSRSSARRSSETMLSANAEGKTSATGQARNASQQVMSRKTADGSLQQPQEPTLDETERRRVIDSVITNLREHYVDPNGTRKVSVVLSAHEKNGDYGEITSGKGFAELITKQMRDVTQDSDLMVVYSQQPIPEHLPGLPPGALDDYRAAMAHQNCTFEKVQMLPHNIGYLKLDSFPDPSLCRATAVAAMARLNHADAILFDLRDNGGGYPSMVSLIASYLFDHPVYMFNPRESVTPQSWTQSPVVGNRLANKPVYILTSASTFSGAERFCYNLKMLRRASLVGERTRGGAHTGVFHRIDDHFAMGIPETRAINPYAKGDWEGIGVEPDVKVQAAHALETAEKLAETKVHSNQTARVHPFNP